VAQSTILSSGTVNGADTLTIEVIRPDSMPAVVRIVWPTAATITTPASYREVASAACVCSLRPPRIWPESERVDGSNGDSDNPFRPLQPSPLHPCFFEGGDCTLVIKISYVEADTGRKGDVGCPMILGPPLDHLGIDRGVVQSRAAVPRRDQRLLLAARAKARREGLACSAYASAGARCRCVSLVLKQVVVQPALTAND
jgi:hypothetical protein